VVATISGGSMTNKQQEKDKVTETERQYFPTLLAPLSIFRFSNVKANSLPTFQLLLQNHTKRIKYHKHNKVIERVTKPAYHVQLTNNM
jgi:hypothetical protein